MSTTNRSIERVHDETLIEWLAIVHRCHTELGYRNPCDPCPQTPDKFSQHAAHFLVCDGNDAFGTFRFVVDSSVGLPMAQVFDLKSIGDLGPYFEVSNLATTRRGGFLKGLNGDKYTDQSLLFAVVCYSAAFATVNNKTTFLGMIDFLLFLRFNAAYNNTLEPLSGLAPVFFDGGWVVAAQFKIWSFIEQVAREHPAVLDYIAAISPDAVRLEC